MSKRVSAAVGIVLVICIGLAGRSEAKIIREFDVAGWTGMAFDDTQDGTISRCGVLSFDQNGLDIAFAVTRRHNWSLTVINRNWDLTVRQAYEVDLYIDGIGPVPATGFAQQSNTLVIPLPDELMDPIRRGNRFDVVAANKTYSFGLTGSAQALQAALDCVGNGVTSQAQTAEAQLKPVLTRQSQAAPAKAARNSAAQSKPPAGTDTTASDQASQDGLRAEASTTLANILSQASVTGYHIFNTNEVPPELKDHHASWTKDNVFGTLDVVPTANSQTLAVLADEFVANDARICQGKFASNRENDSETGQIAEVITACQGTETDFMTHYAFLNRPTGGLYVSSIVTDMSSAGTRDDEPGDEAASGDGSAGDSGEVVDQHFRTAAYRLLGRYPAQK